MRSETMPVGGEPRRPPLGSILHVADLSGIGGIPRVVRGLAVGHCRQGLDVHVAIACVDAAEGRALGAPFGEAGVTVHEIVVRPRAYWRHRSELASLCRALRPCVLHTHGLRSDVLGTAVGRSLGIPVISTIHGFTGDGLKNSLYEWLHRRAMRRADAVIAVARPLAARLLALGVAERRLHVIPNAFAAPGALLPRDEARRILGVPAEGLLAGWVGRLSPEKGADVAIEALKLVADSVCLSLLGDGPERNAVVRRVQALGLQERVHVHGTVADADQLYAAFDVFILSSRTEGTPIALFEAMSAGVPVVATAVGGVPDVVSPAEALLVPSDQPAALAQAVRMVLTDSRAAQQRAEAARRRLHAEFAVAPWLARHSALYADLVDPQRAG